MGRMKGLLRWERDKWRRMPICSSNFWRFWLDRNFFIVRSFSSSMSDNVVILKQTTIDTSNEEKTDDSGDHHLYSFIPNCSYSHFIVTWKARSRGSSWRQFGRSAVNYRRPRKWKNQQELLYNPGWEEGQERCIFQGEAALRQSDQYLDQEQDHTWWGQSGQIQDQTSVSIQKEKVGLLDYLCGYWNQQLARQDLSRSLSTGSAEVTD